MAFCSNCGTQLDENTNFCPSCSAPTGNNINQNQPQAAPVQQAPPQAAPVQQPQPQAAPVQQPQPQAAPVQQPQPQVTPMQGYQPQGTPVQGYQPQPTPMQGYQPQGTPVQGYQPQGTPMQGYQPQGAPMQQNYAQGSPSQQNFFQKLNNTPDTTSQYDPRDIADNKIMAVLAYFGILVLIPMFAAPKNSRYARFHVQQGFTLFLSYIAYGIVYFLLRLIKVTRYIWGVPYKTTPGIVLFIGWVIGIPLFILSILGIINAVQGKAKELPIIGKYKIIK